MASHDVALVGAPDKFLGTTQARSKPVQIMQLDMSSGMLEELLECARSGKAPQVLFGGNPSIKYGGSSIVLESHPEKHRRELYMSTSKTSKERRFAGVMNFSLSAVDANEATAGVDHALEVLKSRVAAANLERENNMTLRAQDILAGKAKNSTLSRSTINKTIAAASSPALAASKPSSVKSSSKTATMDPSSSDPSTSFLRKPVIHRLAMGPQSFNEASSAIVPQSHQDQFPHLKSIFKAVAKSADPEKAEGTWTLTDKSYKEVFPYQINFTEEQREKVVNNAVRAFDRMRLSREDPLWQQLLPVDERGKGKCLSRLNLAADMQNRTPVMTPKRPIDKKTGLPKKLEVKKVKKPVDETEKVSPEKGKPGLQGKDSKVKDTTSTVAKRTPVVKPAKPAEQPTSSGAASTKQPDQRARANEKPRLNNTPQQRATKPSATAKSLLNKPKNPSPLSRSPPVNASDFANDHPVHSKLSAAASPPRVLKRKAEAESDVPIKRQQTTLTGVSTGTNLKVAKPGTSTTSSSTGKPQDKPTVSTPLSSLQKRKAGQAELDSDRSAHSTPNKIRRTTTTTTTNGNSNVHPLNSNSHSSGSSSSSGGSISGSTKATTVTRTQPHVSTSREHPRADRTPSSTCSDLDDDEKSKPARLTWRQALDAAVRFDQYYPKYQKLWLELVRRETPPRPEEREELMRMHRKIGEMKRQILEANRRGQAV